MTRPEGSWYSVSFMRWIGVLAGVLLLGCATTVQRLPGDVPQNGGTARGACESDAWLTLARTRSQSPSESGHGTTPRSDGLALYRSGATSPESIPALADELGSTPMIERHRARAERDSGKKWLGAGLGVAGLVALGVGAYLFATSFETQKTTRSDGSTSEEQKIATGRAVAGGILVGAGFGFGVAGIVVSPSTAERARADQDRYVFLPPDDDPKEVGQLVTRYNQGVRDRCEKAAP
jgi:hypothetical protein